jgi:hypothetical protein
MNPSVVVSYEYHFHPESIDVKTEVTPNPTGGAFPDQYAKEPKFTTEVVNGTFNQFRVRDSKGDMLDNAGLNDPRIHTEQWGMNNRASAEFGFDNYPGCPAGHPCLRITAKASPSDLWDSGLGLDRWSKVIDSNASFPPAHDRIWDSDPCLGNCSPDSPTCTIGGHPYRCSYRDCGHVGPAAYPAPKNYTHVFCGEDTGTIAWSCYTTPAGGAANSINRRWEAAGGLADTRPGIYFHAWEGGEGPTDCETTSKNFPVGESFKNYFVISLVNN